MKVIFYSTSWCPSCRTMKPWVKELYPETTFVELTDTSPEIEALGLQSVPTIVVTDDDGAEIERMTGGASRGILFEFLNRNGLVK